MNKHQANQTVHMYIHIYIYIYTHTHMEIHTHTWRERERERETYLAIYVSLYDHITKMKRQPRHTKAQILRP